MGNNWHFNGSMKKKNGFLVLVSGPGLDSISPSISKIKNAKPL